MGNLYVIRHGQTTFNADAVIQGPRVDSELSELGHRQAAALAEAFLETPLDGVYTSPLRRARQTALAMMSPRRDAVTGKVVPELYEMDYGTFCGQPLAEVEEEVRQILDAWSMGFVDKAFPGGESPILAQHRIRSIATSLMMEALQRDIAVVAHGRINRVLLATMTGTPLNEQGRFPQDNANINHVEVDLDGAHLRRVNDVTHLESVVGAFS